MFDGAVTDPKTPDLWRQYRYDMSSETTTALLSDHGGSVFVVGYIFATRFVLHWLPV